MKNLTKPVVICSLLCVVASGCARTPNVKVGYYLSESVVSAEVTRAVTCDNDKNPIVASSFLSTVSHGADRSAFESIPLDELDGFLSNSKLTFEFFEDGRLQGINATSVGRGQNFIKSVAGLAASLGARTLSADTPPAAPQGARPGSEENDKPPNVKLCEYIERTVKGKSKVLTLKFGGVLELEGCTGCCVNSLLLEAKHESKVHVDYLKEEGVNLGTIRVSARPIEDGNEERVVVGNAGGDAVTVAVRDPASVRVEVTIEDGTFKGTEDSWSGSVLVAQCGKRYSIPVPRSALFGEQAFKLVIAESGAVTRLGYNKDTGAAHVVGIGQDVFDVLGRSAAAKAQTAAMKAEADRIAAQQRLVRCRADPENCN